VAQRVGTVLAPFFLTSALEGVRGHQHASAAIYPGKNPLYRRLDGLQS